METSTESRGMTEVFDVLRDNERAVARYYRMSVSLLIGVMIIHLVFAMWHVVKRTPASSTDVLQFVAFNATAHIIAVIFARISFMLSSRAGQLRDLRCGIILSRETADASKLESVCRTIMALRRDAKSMRILDLEAVAAAAQKASKK